jgi:hypothetical protein
MPSLRIAFLCAAAAFLVGACAPSGPLRKADQAMIGSTGADTCQALYDETDRDIYKIATDFSKTHADRTRFLNEEKAKIHFGEPCWTTAFERHQHYDLLYAEFDDEGNAVDVAKGAAYRDSELYLIESQLTELLAKEGGLNLVVFTHGWHGNARPDNSYSLEFKGLLIDISKGEEALAGGRSKSSAAISSPSSPAKAFRTVGIEIAWRGDSFDTYVKCGTESSPPTRSPKARCMNCLRFSTSSISTIVVTAPPAPWRRPRRLVAAYTCCRWVTALAP